MIWEWMLSSFMERYAALPGSDMPGIKNQSIFNTQVQFNLTDVGPPLTNIIATLFSPQRLNGTRMTCGGQSLTILIPKPISKFVNISYLRYIVLLHTVINSMKNKYLMWYSNVNVTIITSN